MKFVWLAVLMGCFFALYLFSILALMSGFNLIGWSMIAGFGLVLLGVSIEYIREYWI